MAISAAPLQYLTSTRIGEKGQLTVPKEFRRDLQLGNGSPFAVLRLGDGLILLPEKRRFERLCERISSLLSGAGVASTDLLSTLPTAREQVFSEHYGAGAAVKIPRPSRRRSRLR